MPQQTRMTKDQQAADAKQVAEEYVEPVERTPEQDALIDKSDDLLDEIDAALEGLDTEQVTSFTQMGGE